VSRVRGGGDQRPERAIPATLQNNGRPNRKRRPTTLKLTGAGSCARMPPQAEFRVDRPESRKLGEKRRVCAFFAQKRSPFSRQNVLKFGTTIRTARKPVELCVSSASDAMILDQRQRLAERSQPRSNRNPRSLVCNGTSTRAKFINVAGSCPTLDLLSRMNAQRNLQHRWCGAEC
jgi:hypothetical protein